MSFMVYPCGAEWLTTALQTITPEHRNLRQISISVLDAWQTAGDAICGQWLSLDRLLVQLLESRSIHPNVVLGGMQGTGKRYCIERLLPELTKRGLVELIE